MFAANMLLKSSKNQKSQRHSTTNCQNLYPLWFFDGFVLSDLTKFGLVGFSSFWHAPPTKTRMEAVLLGGGYGVPCRGRERVALAHRSFVAHDELGCIGILPRRASGYKANQKHAPPRNPMF